MVGLMPTAFAHPGNAIRSSPREDRAKPEDVRPCSGGTNCLNVGTYTATITDIVASDTPTWRLARLIMRFTNRSDDRIFLAYRARSCFLIDNFGNRFFYSKNGDWEQDMSAVGIGTDVGNKIDPQFMLKPKESGVASFDLWRQRPPNEKALSYEFSVMIDEIDPSDLKTVLWRPLLQFHKVPAKLSQPLTGESVLLERPAQ